MNFSTPKKYTIDQAVPIAPLISFRIIFGLLMFVSIVRFWWNGWIDSLYVNPKFHFTYLGFEWVHAFDRQGMYLIFLCIAISALMMSLGLLYRLSSVVFFLSFTYVELIDVTTYLNHYYFISLIALLMIGLPAHRDYSLDVRIWPSLRRLTTPAWTIDLLRFQMAVVYVFAGLAKLNYDWLIEALPMRIWLPAKSHLPLIGHLMYAKWIAYLFAWFGAVYDLLIAFFLLNKRSRPIAYLFVLIFHTATAIFFPAIGMFPYVMMSISFIFFSATVHEKTLSLLPYYVHRLDRAPSSIHQSVRYAFPSLIKTFVLSYVILQLVIPLRYLFYPGKLFWHEEGYRFSWRVMLMEKSGHAVFTVTNPLNKEKFEVNNAEFLTPLQEKMMSTQPDLILKYAHHIAQQYRKRGIEHPKVQAEIYVTLNGQRSRLFIDSSVNLAAESVGWHHYSWVLPYKN